MTRVVILAPNLLLRIGLREMLRDQTEITIAGEASSPTELMDMEADAEVVLAASASADWFEQDGGFGLQQAVLLLTDDPALALALAERGGLWGVLPSDPDAEQLCAGIRAVRQGLAVFPPRLAAKLLRESKRLVQGLESAADTLTPREVEMLGLIAQGLANKQIAAQLHISEHTVKFHISSVYAKLGVNSRTEAVRRGMQQGLIEI